MSKVSIGFPKKVQRLQKVSKRVQMCISIQKGPKWPKESDRVQIGFCVQNCQEVFKVSKILKRVPFQKKSSISGAIGSTVSKMVQRGPNWSKVFKGSKIEQKVQKAQELSKSVQKGLNFPNSTKAPKVPKRVQVSTCVQKGPKWPKVFERVQIGF